MQGDCVLFILLSGLERICELNAVMLTPDQISLSPEELRAANISPATYLATDFLNHYNEVAMLIDLLAMDPEVSEDVLEWSPMTYIDHFSQSGFRDRDLAIHAYRQADPQRIRAFEASCRDLDDKIIHIQELLKADDVETAASQSKELYAGIAEINTLIVGGADIPPSENNAPDDAGVSQSEIDDLFA